MHRRRDGAYERLDYRSRGAAGGTEVDAYGCSSRESVVRGWCYVKKWERAGGGRLTGVRWGASVEGRWGAGRRAQGGGHLGRGVGGREQGTGARPYPHVSRRKRTGERVWVVSNVETGYE